MIHNICPYPGLRPFTEEESIFFKGRDTHIKQIITQLQDKKIVIVTGNSGAGKSSLIFAGVVPNARAGFFKALYNNWAVATFRPERSPLKNLSEAVALQLDLETNKVYDELQYGFSALVEIYKNSKYFIDPESEQWKNADEEQRKRLKSTGANLLIIADQFEEFFTNPENFAGGKPSPEAYTTVNLLLETASIALRNNLPIYIIFTMRSDYISDCVAFKGLPEYIGYSQFFVPRLKRNELQQVIEEPAKLAGGSVSKRLSEVLINGLREGFDQLPILQHTLNLLWKRANNGKEELNLIHLARVAGLHRSYLDDKDKEEFDKWFETLPENEKKYFEHPSLSNVLNYHANTLYDNAYNYFLEKAHWADKDLTEEEAKYIIKICFSGLTRIDEGRAVRNRMSLKEITNLIGNPKIDYAKVNGVINIFREPESTFIRPFIDPEDIKTQYIPSSTILDITHESLIRNWELLQKWEAEEEENLNDFLEFKVQLQRWLDSGKSKAYLLPLGTLSYFEKWYERCKPNKYWIAKYDKSDKNKEEKLEYAQMLADATVEYLEASKANIIAQEKRKRRLRAFFAIFATIVIIALSGFALWALREKRNAEIQTQIAEKKKNEALQANRKAEEERQRAELQKLRAEEEARKALVAKMKSDSAMRLAVQLRKIAEQKSQQAREEAYKALMAKRRADSLRLIAERQKQIADEQRQKAIEANKEANRLTILSLTQSLAFKATQKYDDKQTNLLLAYYAYYLNKKYNGNPHDPVIYEGLRYAYFLAKNIKSIKISDASIRAVYNNDLINLTYITIDGDIYKFNIKSLDKKEITLKKKYRTGKVLKASFMNGQRLIVQNLNRDLYLVDLNKKNSIKFAEGLKDVKALSSKGNNIFAVTPNKLYHWKIENGRVTLVREIKFNKPIIKIAVSGKEDKVYLGSMYGAVYETDITTGDNFLLIKPKDKKLDNVLTTMYVSPQSNYLTLGFANGNVDIYKTVSSTKFTTINVLSSSIHKISFDDNETQMVVLAPKQYLSIYYLDSIHERPITIHNKNALEYFNIIEDMIYAYDNKNGLWIYQTNPDAYAEVVYKMLKRNFTTAEWNMFFGNTINKFDLVK